MQLPLVFDGSVKENRAWFEVNDSRENTDPPGLENEYQRYSLSIGYRYKSQRAQGESEAYELK